MERTKRDEEIADQDDALVISLRWRPLSGCLRIFKKDESASGRLNPDVVGKESFRTHGKTTSGLNLKMTFKRPEEVRLLACEPLAIVDLLYCKHN